jgi:hypothetical protein
MKKIATLLLLELISENKGSNLKSRGMKFSPAQMLCFGIFLVILIMPVRVLRLYGRVWHAKPKQPGYGASLRSVALTTLASHAREH